MEAWVIYASSAAILLAALFIGFALDVDVQAVLSGARKTHSSLPEPPTHGSPLSLFTTFCLVLTKYLGSPKLKQNSNGTFDLPSTEVRAPIVVDDDDVELYYRAVYSGKDKSKAQAVASSSKVNNPLFLLTALTTPLLLQLLCKKVSPVLPLGAINVRNRFDFVNPEACRSLRAYQKNHQLTATARMGGPDLLGKRVKRGMQFDIVVEVQDETKAVIFRQTFTTLQMGKLPGPKPVDPPAAAQEQRKYIGEPQELTIDRSAPTRYASVCKDYNPIHMSSLAAKIFGFKRKIVHGNLTAALVMHLATSDTGKPFEEAEVLAKLWSSGKTASYLTVDFKRPIPVPAKVSIRWAADGAQVITKRGSEEKVLVDIRSETV